ncbi:MAG TPA: hypothetical protein VGC17_00045 [Lactovum miscens]|uniref:hypothetical protein n=1 Tax=Lactovum miscens TaxID=190387 RepID=UPI002ED91142
MSLKRNLETYQTKKLERKTNLEGTSACACILFLQLALGIFNRLLPELLLISSTVIVILFIRAQKKNKEGVVKP